jgi:DNA-binding CsgD family transcriptional regulator
MSDAGMVGGASALVRTATGRYGGTPATWLTAAALLILLGADLAIRDITLGVLAAVLVVAAWLYLGRLAGSIIIALAVTSRVVAAFLGDIPAAMAAIESAAYVSVAALMAAASRRSTPSAGPLRALAPQAQQLNERPFAVPAVTSGSSSALTRREREVVAMASRGMSSARIAERLFISRRTVESHLAHAYDKLEVHSKQDLIAWALAAAPAESAE